MTTNTQHVRHTTHRIVAAVARFWAETSYLSRRQVELQVLPQPTKQPSGRRSS
ncbi:MAG TPA: hypothetical protein VGE11_15905 [Pseudonocardia sp.]